MIYIVPLGEAMGLRWELRSQKREFAGAVNYVPVFVGSLRQQRHHVNAAAAAIAYPLDVLEKWAGAIDAVAELGQKLGANAGFWIVARHAAALLREAIDVRTRAAA